MRINCAASAQDQATNGISMRFLTINGERHWLWRAVDQDAYVLDILVQCRRNKKGG